LSIADDLKIDDDLIVDDSVPVGTADSERLARHLERAIER
jgi:hypothetical protein